MVRYPQPGFDPVGFGLYPPGVGENRPGVAVSEAARDTSFRKQLAERLFLSRSRDEVELRKAGSLRAFRPELRVTRHEVPWPELSSPTTVAHVTDILVGWSTPVSLLEEVADAARAEKPDVTVLTGDYVNLSLRSFRTMEAFVRRLPSPVVAVLGNHDHYAGAEIITERLEALGVRVLRNAHHAVSDLTIVGVDDGWSGKADVKAAFKSVSPGQPTLVLTHFPATANLIAPFGPRLILSGHTHGGQFELPGGWTEWLSRRSRLEGYLRGFYSLENGAQLYVNAGLGHARRGMRRGELCRPELALFTLDPAKAPAFGAER